MKEEVATFHSIAMVEVDRSARGRQIKWRDPLCVGKDGRVRRLTRHFRNKGLRQIGRAAADAGKDGLVRVSLEP